MGRRNSEGGRIVREGGRKRDRGSVRKRWGGKERGREGGRKEGKRRRERKILAVLGS